MGGSEFLQDVYAKHLPTDFGYPLRTPEPSLKLPESYQNEGLQIGDVGYVDRWGVFHVLFNIRYSSNHDLHRKRRLPTGFEPIKLDDEAVNINPDAIPAGHILGSRHIVDKPPEQPDKRVLHRFVPSSSSGAILILPFGAIRHELNEIENKTLRKIAVEHAERWCAVAGRDSVYLITGFHKARSWSLGSFHEAPPEGEILVKQPELKEQDENAKIHEWAPNFPTTYWRAGPGGAEHKHINQTVFITGFTVTVRSWLSIPDVQPLHSSSSAWFAFFRLPMVLLFGILRMLWQRIYPNTSQEPVALLSQPFHPSAAINHHLLAKNRDIRVAVTHDRQWMGVLDMDNISDKGILKEDYVWEVLSDKCTLVFDNHAVWLESKSGDGTKGSQVASGLEGTSLSSLSGHDTFVPISEDGNKSHSMLEVFSVRAPSTGNPWIVISGIRADGVIAGLTRLPIGFYVLFQFNGVQRRTKVRSMPVCESIIEWDDEIILSNDPSTRVQVSFCAAFEFQPMLGNGTTLCMVDITVGNLVGSTSLINFSSEARERCSSLLITAERRYGPGFEAYSCRDRGQEEASAVAYETDLGNNALVRYYEHYREDDLRNAIGHFECALRVCHVDDECRPAALFNLATVTLRSFEASGVDTAIAQSIALYRESLEMRHAPHPDCAATLLGLGQALLHCYRRQGQDESVADEMKKLMNEVKMICPEGSHFHRAARLVIETSKRVRAQFCTLSEIDMLILDLDAAARLPPEEYFDCSYRLENLGLALRQRFEMQGDCGQVADLDQAIATQEDALRLIHEHCPGHAPYLSHLGGSLYTRFKKLGNLEDIGRAIALLEEAVKLTPENHPDRALHLDNLGVSLRARFDVLEDIEDIGRAVAMGEEVMKLTPENHLDHARHLDSLGGFLRVRFNKVGDPEDLRRAIAIREEAVKLTPENHPDRAQRLENLGRTLWACFKKLGGIEDIGQAIARGEEAVKLTPDNHPQRAQRLDSIGGFLRVRFNMVGDIEDIGRAIAMGEEAVKLTRENHSYRARQLDNLGGFLRARFNKVGDIEDLRRAIVMREEAVKLTPENHPDRAQRLENLGRSLKAHFDKHGDIEAIGRAIVMDEEALKLTLENHSDRARRVRNFQQSLWARFSILRDMEDLKRAGIVVREEAEKVTPENHAQRPDNLGVSRGSFQHARIPLGSGSLLNKIPFKFGLSYDIKSESKKL